MEREYDPPQPSISRLNSESLPQPHVICFFTDCESYLEKCRQYADNYLAFKQAAARDLVTIPAFVNTPALHNLPRHRWFEKVYQLDVISRLDFELAEFTSTFGEILKIDSTMKITNYLAANRATNILMYFLSEGKGRGLKQMLVGIISRYSNAGVPPPKVMYPVRDCCGLEIRYTNVADDLKDEQFVEQPGISLPGENTTSQVLKLSSSKLQRLIYLWEHVSTFDKKRTIFPKRFTKKPWPGKFGGRGKKVSQVVGLITGIHYDWIAGSWFEEGPQDAQTVNDREYLARGPSETSSIAFT
ncbi:hypothetical protein DPMN_130456 [Dreissena polymorpha]|uniref:Uncharacterized protein n=1 Tax=Dreissena polymorpha TaxID=45954 RepID=A0A9D4H2Z1_DREPO|nr:hypothetical protein DPMN_130456 [Dreissena polymorpha]